MKEVNLIKFEADWCGPCQAMKPIVRESIEDLQKTHPNLKYTEVNVDKEPGLAAQFEVSSIPTIVVTVNGEQVSKYVGVKSKNFLKAEIEKHLA